MKKTALALIGALLAATMALPVAATTVNTSPDVEREAVLPRDNSINYWFTKLDAEWCDKVPAEGGYFTLEDIYLGAPSRLIIKQGQMTFVWFDPEPGNYAGPYAQPGGSGGQGWSHAIVCGKDRKDTKKVDPSARIIGPAGDPFFRYVLNNRRSERPVTFIVSPWGRRVTVPAGCVYRTGWHYERPYTALTVKRGNGQTLARRSSGAGGFYGPLYRGFEQGLSCP
jgi:hypothetical protein